jgi:molybdenum cofactor biosynthesis enzyme
MVDVSAKADSERVQGPGGSADAEGNCSLIKSGGLKKAMSWRSPGSWNKGAKQTSSLIPCPPFATTSVNVDLLLKKPIVHLVEVGLKQQAKTGVEMEGLLLYQLRPCPFMTSARQ